VAVAQLDGPDVALILVEELEGEPRLADYHYLPAIKADLLRRLGREDEALAEGQRLSDWSATTPSEPFSTPSSEVAGPEKPDAEPAWALVRPTRSDHHRSGNTHEAHGGAARCSHGNDDLPSGVTFFDVRHRDWRLTQ